MLRNDKITFQKKLGQVGLLRVGMVGAPSSHEGVRFGRGTVIGLAACSVRSALAAFFGTLALLNVMSP